MTRPDDEYGLDPRRLTPAEVSLLVIDGDQDRDRRRPEAIDDTATTWTNTDETS